MQFAKVRLVSEQILCFLPSTRDVRDAVALCDEHKNIKAMALMANSSPTANEISVASVFFSTTIAETSLTFPNLVKVVDVGRIIVPEFDPVERVTRLTSQVCIVCSVLCVVCCVLCYVCVVVCF